MYKKRKKLIRYISEKIGDVGVDCRVDILNHIAGWYGTNIIWENGEGCGILFAKLTDKTLNEIKKMIEDDLSKHLIDFRGI